MHNGTKKTCSKLHDNDIINYTIPYELANIGFIECLIYTAQTAKVALSSVYVRIIINASHKSIVIFFSCINHYVILYNLICVICNKSATRKVIIIDVDPRTFRIAWYAYIYNLYKYILLLCVHNIVTSAPSPQQRGRRQGTMRRSCRRNLNCFPGKPRGNARLLIIFNRIKAQGLCFSLALSLWYYKSMSQTGISR